MSMYGAIPLVHAHSTQGSVGVLALSASETWVDVERPAAGGGRAATHWMAESGILDLFLLTGGRGEAGPRALGKQYASLTGPSALPAHWALGYHQCRWNYLDQADVLDVDRRFDEVTADEAASDKGGQGWPLDVTWLDIEYAEEHRYFDWDVRKFPDVKGMLAKIAAKGRKVRPPPFVSLTSAPPLAALASDPFPLRARAPQMVAIVDPHIKRSPAFGVYSSAVAQDLVVKQAGSAVNGSRTDFEGWCWPGSSVWVDFFLERSWGWWAELFRFETWTDSARNLFIWNDMNGAHRRPARRPAQICPSDAQAFPLRPTPAAEPSVFNGPEISMPRDALHQDGKWEHRDV
jgi:alpha 1,3-glucosidase